MARRVRSAVAIVDTSVLYALVDRREPAHARCVEALEQLQGTVLVLSPFVLAEVDYLVSARLGHPAAAAVLRDVGRGAFRLAPFENDDVLPCLQVIDNYADLGIGLADASNVVLAERLGTRVIMTLDHRHFRALRTARGHPFRLVPNAGT